MEYIIPFFILLAVLFYVFNRQWGQRQARAPLRNAELVKVLLNLEEQPLEQLFSLYERHFGEGPARYARQTYAKWKSGKVRPNKQTFSRFLINLPKVMSFDLKCEVLRELREAYGAREQYKLTVRVDDWKEKVTPLVESIIAKAENGQIPIELERKLRWLSEDDARVANELLDRTQRRQALDALTMLDEEFSSIESLLKNSGGRTKVKHTLKLPYGTIALKIKRS